MQVDISALRLPDDKSLDDKAGYDIAPVHLKEV